MGRCSGGAKDFRQIAIWHFANIRNLDHKSSPIMKTTLYSSTLYNHYCTHPVKAYATVAATGKTAEDGRGRRVMIETMRVETRGERLIAKTVSSD